MVQTRLDDMGLHGEVKRHRDQPDYFASWFRMAKALGLNVPTSIPLRATEMKMNERRRMFVGGTELS